jgi:hypothetical protein
MGYFACMIFDVMQSIPRLCLKSQIRIVAIAKNGAVASSYRQVHNTIRVLLADRFICFLLLIIIVLLWAILEDFPTRYSDDGICFGNYQMLYGRVPSYYPRLDHRWA